MTAHLRIASVSRKPSRARLLAGSAICGAAALLANPAAALDPNTLPDVTGVMTAAGALGSGGLGSATAPIVNAPVATILTVDIDAARSIIDWKSFSVGSAAEVDFNGMKAGDIAVNRSPLQMVIEGTVNGGPGSLWFLSPGGVLVQGGGKIASTTPPSSVRPAFQPPSPPSTPMRP
jgi:filamentous hemagglutinin family protein